MGIGTIASGHDEQGKVRVIGLLVMISEIERDAIMDWDVQWGEIMKDDGDVIDVYRTRPAGTDQSFSRWLVDHAEAWLG